MNLKVTNRDGWVEIPLGTTSFTLNVDEQSFYIYASSPADLTTPDSNGDLPTGAKMTAYVPYLIDSTRQYYVRTDYSEVMFDVEA